MSVPSSGFGFLAVIGAWTIGWTPLEQALYDYDLLSHASVEVVPRSPGAGVTYSSRQPTGRP